MLPQYGSPEEMRHEIRNQFESNLNLTKDLANQMLFNDFGEYPMLNMDDVPLLDMEIEDKENNEMR